MKRILFLLIWICLFTNFIHTPSGLCQTNTEMSVSNQTETLRHEARRIFEDPRFDYPDYLGWFQLFLKKVAALFTHFHVSKPINFAPQLKIFMSKIYFGLALLLPILIFLVFRRFWQPESRLSSKVIQNATTTAPQQLLITAKQFANSGEFREAIRYIYLESLEQLKHKNLLPEGSGFSDNDHLRILCESETASQRLIQAFQDLLRLFQEKWYGMKCCQADDYTFALRLLEIIAGGDKKDAQI